MDPMAFPEILSNMSDAEQISIPRLAHTVHVHLLKHGGISSKGHCIAFPQALQEPATILPRVSAKVDIIRVRRQGKDATHKDFRVGRHRVEGALRWLKDKNPAYGDAQGTLPFSEFFRDDSCWRSFEDSKRMKRKVLSLLRRISKSSIQWRPNSKTLRVKLAPFKRLLMNKVLRWNIFWKPEQEEQYSSFRNTGIGWWNVGDCWRESQESNQREAWFGNRYWAST